MLLSALFTSPIPSRGCEDTGTCGHMTQAHTIAGYRPPSMVVAPSPRLRLFPLLLIIGALAVLAAATPTGGQDSGRKEGVSIPLVRRNVSSKPKGIPYHEVFRRLSLRTPKEHQRGSLDPRQVVTNNSTSGTPTSGTLISASLTASGTQTANGTQITSGTQTANGTQFPSGTQSANATQTSITSSSLTNSLSTINVTGTSTNAAPAATSSIGNDEGVQSLPLVDMLTDILWAGNISIGTPAQTFVVDLDTSSPWLWVTSHKCTSSVCTTNDSYISSAHKYNSTASSTSVRMQADLTNGPRTGSDSKWVSDGSVFSDTVSIADITMHKASFIAASNVSLAFGQRDVIGSLGLGLPLEDGQSFVKTAFDSKLIPAPAFGLKLTDDEAELYLGGDNKALYNGSLEYYPVASAGAPYWKVANGSVYLDDTVLQSNVVTTFDTGTPLVFAPWDQVKAIYSTTSQYFIDPHNGLVAYICGDNCSCGPSVGFSWGGKKWSLPRDKFAIRQRGNTCLGSIAAYNSSENMWLLGDSFLKHVYTAFSFSHIDDEPAIGFAELKA